MICPTGNLAMRLSRPSDKNISLSPSGKSPLEARPSRAHKEGRIAIVTDVGQRDAMDVFPSTDE
jgi:hypothetical protein